MTDRRLLRASDADREAVAERLRGASVEGRLDTAELEDRLGAAMRARTYADLDGLVADLPSGSLTWRRPSRRLQVVPAARSALAVAMPVLMTLAVVTVVVAAVAVAAAWWVLWVVAGLVMCRGRGCSPRRVGAGPRARGSARAPGVRRTRPAGLH